MRTRLGWLSGAMLLLTACHEEKPYTKPLTTVKVQVVDTYQSAQGERYSGNIEPLTRIDVAFRLGGYVEEILTVPAGSGRRLIQEGDPVSKDAILVKLRQNDYTVKVDEAQSQLDQANFAVAQAEQGVKGNRAALEKARLDHERATNLFRTQSLTKPDLDGAQAQMDGAQAQLDGAEAQVKLAMARVAGAKSQLEESRIALRDSALKSPIDGVVLKRVVEIGSLVGPGSPAYVIGDIREVKSVFGVPDTVLPHLRMGLTLPVSSEGVPGVNYPGRITSIAPTADPKSRVFSIELTVPNAEFRLKPGMIASITVEGGPRGEPVPVVPLNAVVQAPPGKSGYTVFVLDEQGGKATVKSRAVDLGDAVGERITVKKGLRGGERVVVTGASLVSDGETVEVIP
jgi:multidrug efflux system membrane fusion protein